MKIKINQILFILLMSALGCMLVYAAGNNRTRQVPAFPGAEGAGALTVGGRGGSIYRVTNLNPDGPGSLADAVSRPNRIIVFTVSGIIDLTKKKKGKSGKIFIEQPHITIAGQTAPGEGICLKGGSLDVQASDVIIRYLRSRRGFVQDGDMGDSIAAKPAKAGVMNEPVNQTREVFDKRKEKKLGRGKDISTYAYISNIIFDHLSASWASDENLTVKGPDNSTIQYCIIAEGLDYTNPKQTPPNHAEGSLWGVQAGDGRSTLHHTLYAHNRLRNPRLVSGDEPPAVLDFCNNVIYNASELFSHTGSGTVYANWINNYYKYGPSTPKGLRKEMFRFENDPNSRMFASGNFIFGFEDAARDNWLAVKPGKRLVEQDIKLMRVNKKFDTPPVKTQSAQEAYELVLADAGASLPSRDTVDLRIVNDVHRGTGRIINKETDFAEERRWPDYRSLPCPADSDADGIPDFWEDQFGLNKNDPADSTKISISGYANIEHYFNNTAPAGNMKPIVFISAAIPRAYVNTGQAGEWVVTRTGSIAEKLEIFYTVGGSAEKSRDFRTLSGRLIIPAKASSAVIKLIPMKEAVHNTAVIVTLRPGKASYHAGCPSASLIVIKKQ